MNVLKKLFKIGPYKDYKYFTTGSISREQWELLEIKRKVNEIISHISNEK